MMQRAVWVLHRQIQDPGAFCGDLSLDRHRMGQTHGRDLRVVRATWAKGGCQDTDSTLSMLCVVGR